MAYPAQLKSMASRLTNYSSTYRKVTPLGKDGNYRAGETVRFLLPSNTLIDFRTLALHVTASTGADFASLGKGVVLLPSLSTSLIDQIIMTAGGVQIEATPRQWGQLAKMLDDYTSGSEKRRCRTLLNHERISGLSVNSGEFFKVGLNANNDSAISYPTLAPGARDENRRLVVDEWPGCFLGTVQPSVVSSALTGDIMVEVRFSPNSVLINGKLTGTMPDAFDTADCDRMDIDGQEQETVTDVPAPITSDEVPIAPFFRLDDVHLSVKTIDISDGKFYDWLKSEVTSEPLTLPFNHWVMQPGATTAPGDAHQTTRMTVNSSSVDLLLGTFVGADFESGTMLPGRKVIYTSPEARANDPTIPDTYKRQGSYGNSQTSRYFQRGGIDINQPFESSFSVNNVQLDYPADLWTAFKVVKNEFNLGQTQNCNLNPRLQTLAHYAQGFFLVPCRLNFNAGDAYNSRYLSGLDSRNSTLNILWKTGGKLELDAGLAPDGTAAAKYLQVIPQLWAGCTSVLRVSPGRVLDIVQ